MSAARALSCPVAGNGDLYGLGIRIGLYIQMVTVQLSGLLSTYFRVDDHIGQGTIVFVLSTLIVLARLVAASIASATGNGTDPPIEPVEVFPVLTLLLIQVGVCRVPARNKMTLFIWTAELVGLTALYNYFWWRGMDLLPRSCPDDKAFFFVRVSIWGWFRSFNKASAVIAAIGAGVILVFYLGGLAYYLVFVVVRVLQGRRGELSAAPEDSDDQDKERSRALGTVDLLANVGAIVYVEVSLRWNGITGVHSLDSPGQFMPFFIALGQLLSVFYTASKFMLQLHADEGALDQEDDSMLECHHDGKRQYGRGGDAEDVAS